MNEPETRRLGWLPVLGLVLLAFFAYAPSLGNDFALDDTLARAVNEGRPNSVIAELRGPAHYFTSDYWSGFGLRSGLYRPTTIYSYAATHHLFPGEGDGEAFAHHLINLLLNCWAAYLVMWLMLDFGMAMVGALLTAALFAVHGVHSEVVATVIGRAELLSFCFGMAGLKALLRADNGKPAVWIPLSAVLFFLAFCSKESALAWAGFVPCYFAMRGGLRQRWVRLVAAGVPAVAIFFVLRHLALSGDVDPVKYAANPLGYVDLPERLGTACGLWGYGLFLCVAPFSLACLYGPQVETVSTIGLIVAVLIPVWLAAALWRPARRPGLFLSAALFFGFSFITSNIPLAIGTIFGERLYFIPSLGVCMLPALLLARLAPSRQKVLLGACALWAIGCVVVDVQRSLVWKNNETLLLRESEVHLESALLQVTAAKYFHVQEYEQPDRKEFFRERASACLDRALRLDPGYVDAFATKAAMLDRGGRPNEAIAVLRAALDLARLPHSGLEATLRKDLGRLLITERNEISQGLQECLRALSLSPDDLELRVRIIDFGRTALSADVLSKVIDDGLARYPASVILAVQRGDYLFRHPEKNEQSTRMIVEILRDVFGRLPREATGELRFIIGRMQFGDSLTTLGQVAEARRAYQTVLGLRDVPAAIRSKAMKKLNGLRK
jgi:tetratricopeptide (TPR) repeat protein